MDHMVWQAQISAIEGRQCRAEQTLQAIATKSMETPALNKPGSCLHQRDLIALVICQRRHHGWYLQYQALFAFRKMRLHACPVVAAHRRHLVLVLEFLIIDIHELDQLNGVGLGNTEIAQKLE
jgi:hypothetical protein